MSPLVKQNFSREILGENTHTYRCGARVYFSINQFMKGFFQFSSSSNELKSLPGRKNEQVNGVVQEEAVARGDDAKITIFDDFTLLAVLFFPKTFACSFDNDNFSWIDLLPPAAHVSLNFLGFFYLEITYNTHPSVSSTALMCFFSPDRNIPPHSSLNWAEKCF